MSEVAKTALTTPDGALKRPQTSLKGDIHVTQSTCIPGCSYCYVVSSQKAAVANRGKHDPDGVSIVAQS